VLASGAVYCNRSCLCVCVFVEGGRRCPNLTSARTCSVYISLSAFFILFCFSVTLRGQRAVR